MNPIWGHVAGVVTVLLLLIVTGVWLWAWSPFNRNAFDALARLPMHDGGDVDPASEDNER